MQRKTIALMWHYTKPYAKMRWAVLIGSSLTVLSSSIIGPYILSRIFDILQHGHITLQGTWPLIAGYAFTQIYGEVVGWRINLLFSWLYETAAQRDIYHDIFKKLSTESLSFHADRFGGSLVSQANKLSGAFERFWDTITFQLIPTAVSIVASIIVLSFLFWQYALFIFCVTILYGSAVFLGSRFLSKRNIIEAQAQTKQTGRLSDMVTNVLTVKAYGNEQKEIKDFKTYTKNWRGTSLSSMRGFLSVSTVYSSFNALLVVGALVFAIIASENQIISISTVYLSLAYTLTVSRQLWEMNTIMRNYNRIMGDAYDMVDILHTPATIIDNSKSLLRSSNGLIEMKEITFHHEGKHQSQLFQNFSLIIQPGQKVGLVGHSGAGKSTITNLLLRFMDVQDGKILIDGQDIAKVTQESLRKNIAYVLQEPMLFHRSLRENIAYGKPDASNDEIRIAAKKAHALEFIEQLPDGFDTLVGERGVKLSGGQRQRIAIARAILKEAPILILDEATSALDSESEKLIQKSLKDLMKNRTSIVIAHRLSTIFQLDRIIVLEDGAIAEDGNHAALIKQNGIYASLWNHQSGGFLEE